MIATRPVEIVFEQTIDNIKDYNQKYATLQSYDWSDTTNKTNNDLPLALTTAVMTVCGGSKESWFQIRSLKWKKNQCG